MSIRRKENPYGVKEKSCPSARLERAVGSQLPSIIVPAPSQVKIFLRVYALPLEFVGSWRKVLIVRCSVVYIYILLLRREMERGERGKRDGGRWRGEIDVKAYIKILSYTERKIE